jgi:hypothetical protein
MNVSRDASAVSSAHDNFYVCGLLQVDTAPALIEAALRERCAGVRFSIQQNKAGGAAQHRVMLDRSVHISREQADAAWQRLSAAVIIEWPDAVISAARRKP